jgi:drug/metabolite transporter (DMT)-like permease
LFELLALITSVTSALGTILAAKGMKGTSPLGASFYSVLTHAMILTVILLTRSTSVNLSAVAYFAMAGVLALGVGRLLNFVAMRSMGVEKTSAVIGSSPVLTTLLSILLLAEPLVGSTLVGASTVAVGIALISGAKSFKVERALVVSLLSALSYSLSNIVSKAGLETQPDPFLSAQTNATAGLLFLIAYLIATSQRTALRVGRNGLICFIATGALSSIGWLTLMKALEIGVVSIVTTIVYSYPLFTLILGRLFFKEERLSRRTIAGSILIVAGVAVATLL